MTRLLFLTLLAGCVPTSGSLVGPSGATVCSDDGLACLDVPAGALTEEITLSVVPFDGGTPSSLFGLAYSFEPAETVFDTPSTVRIGWAEGEPSGITLGELTGAEFFPLPSFTVDLTGGETSGQTTALGVFLNVAGQDLDGDGHLAGLDCDDTDAAIYPGAAELCDGIDTDCDGILDPQDDADGDGDIACEDCDDTDPSLNLRDADVDGSTSCDGDCDDGNQSVFPSAAEDCDGIDNDCDGIVDNDEDLDFDGFSVCDGDCDDSDPTTWPDAPELCDLVDNDCDGEADEGHDQDGDGSTTCEGECDDYDATVYPGAPEVCDGKDNDCDGLVDEGFDADGDSDPSCSDCDDTDPTVENLDVDGDGVSTCDGDCDDTDAALNPSDNDGDGFHTCESLPAAFDCDDTDPNINPFDADGDGWSTCPIGILADVDCDDSNPDAFPFNGGSCDPTVDNDCDGLPDPWDLDQDGDGFAECDGDCDDTNATVNPSAMELCDGLDNDCDGVVDPLDVDLDGDGFAACGGDCDDSNAAVFPGAPELCDGLDTNCDGLMDADNDGDGASICDDCDDFDAMWQDVGWDCGQVLGPIPTGCAVADVDCETGMDFDGDGYCPDGIDLDGDGFCTDPAEILAPPDCYTSDPAINPGAPELCGDWIDQDCDGAVDEGCGLCSDGIDNDQDGWLDGDDPDCATLDTENGTGLDVCNNGIDDDGDGLLDSLDPGCTSGSDPSE